MRKLLALLTFLSIPTLTHSQNQWNWSGFASLGGGALDQDDVTFIHYDDDLSFKTDSVVGLHLEADLAPQLALTSQVIAQGYHPAPNEDDEFKPELDWLFLSYQWNPEIRLRAGRMRTPHFLYSESVDVGYSYPWVRPPIEVYSTYFSPFNNFEGVDLTWTSDIGDNELDLKLLTGKMGGDFGSNKIKASPIFGANVVLKKNDWLFRYGLLAERTTITNRDTEEIQAFYHQLADLTGSTLFNDIADSFEAKSQWYAYHAVGTQWDHNDWTLLGEGYWISNTGDNFNNQSKSMYLSAIYHYNKFTPYLVLGRFLNVLNKDTLNTIDETYDLFPAGSLGPAVDLLRDSTTSAFEALHIKQKSVTFGTRYDFHPQACFKIEVEYMDFLEGTTGLAQATSPTNRPKDAVLTSFTIDVVF